MNQLRLSCPSWVIPGTYGENLAFLADKSAIHNVELLFFIYDDSVRQELDQDLGLIKNYKSRFTYTAHLPDKLSEDHQGLIEILLPLAEHFIVHPANPEEPQKVDELAGLLQAWRSQYGDLFLAENTKPRWLEAFLDRIPDMPLCMDTGHLGEAEQILAFWHSQRDRIREIHLHSTDVQAAKVDGRLPDHRPLRGDEAWLGPLLQGIIGHNHQILINLELFSWEEVAMSLETLKTFSI
uniref:AP endonuclease n=1 Tax=Gracilinema caldarium TaxID=215591 RepID=A0A7C3EBD0_9SPIR